MGHQSKAFPTDRTAQIVVNSPAATSNEFIANTLLVDEHNSFNPSQELDIDDYLTASSDASSRTRSILIVMIVASVLGLAGLFNSLQSQWMHNRMIRLGDRADPYMTSKLGPRPAKGNHSDAEYQEDIALYLEREKVLCAAIAVAYVENSLVIRVPFFGISFDVNDLGLMGGIGFLVITTCYRFFLTREIDNLRLSFTQAADCGETKLANFYSLLAMRQVFTVPQSSFIKRSPFLIYLPKILTWIPPLLLLAIMAHDLMTGWIGMDLSPRRFLIEITCQAILICLVTMVCWSITKRLIVTDKIWDTVSELLRSVNNPHNKHGAIERWKVTFKDHVPFSSAARPGLLPNVEEPVP